MPHPASLLTFLSCSFGVATMTDESSFKNENKLMDAADVQMYQAKQAG